MSHSAFLQKTHFNFLPVFRLPRAFSRGDVRENYRLNAVGAVILVGVISDQDKEKSGRMISQSDFQFEKHSSLRNIKIAFYILLYFIFTLIYYILLTYFSFYKYHIF